MLKLKVLCLFIVICAMLIISACGRGGHEEDTIDNDNARDASSTVLNILIPDFYPRNPFNIAEATLNQELYKLNRAFELEINTFRYEETIHQIARMEAMMMAGESYDLFLLDREHNLWRFAQSGLVVDIYERIDNCRHTNREDFLTNALNAFTINEGLYAFPMRLTFDYIAINSALPQEFISTFFNMNSITNIEVMSMYLELNKNYYDDFNSLIISNSVSNFFSDDIKARALNDFVNLNEGVSFLNGSGFVSFLDTLRQVQEIQGFPTERFISSTGLSSRQVRQRESRRYMFIDDQFSQNSLFVFFEPINPYFLHHIPLANEAGELYISRFNSPSAFSIAATGNESLAWDFLRHLIAPLVVVNYDYRPHSMAITIPVKRSYIESHFSALIYHNDLDDRFSPNFVGMGKYDDEREERIQQAWERFVAFSEMPVATIPLVPIGIIEEDLSLFMDGVITAEDAALRMHNRVSLWLIE